LTSPKLYRDAKRAGRDIKTIIAMGKKATAFTRSLVDRKEIRLEFDQANADAISAGSSKGEQLQRAPPSGSKSDATVYVSRTGKKYHRAGCRYLRKSKIPISLKDAKARGCTLCSV